MTFSLHPQLKNDTELIISLPLCDVMLMNDQNYPWVILVPRVENASEIFDLNREQQHALWSEVALVAESMKKNLTAKKMNVATLGNMVPQLHLHIVARFEEDAAWPSPVWGKVPIKKYEPSAKDLLITQIRTWITPHS